MVEGIDVWRIFMILFKYIYKYSTNYKIKFLHKNLM